MKRLLSLISSQTAYDALIVLGGSGMSSVLGFVFVFAMARSLGPEQFGVFATIVGYFTFLAAIADLGINQSLVSFINRSSKLGVKKIWINTSLTSVIISSTVIAFLATIIYKLVLIDAWKHETDFSGIIFVGIIVVTLNIFLLALFQSLKKFWQRSIFDNIFSLIRLLIIGLVFLSLGYLTINWGLKSIAWAYGLAFGIGLLMSRKYWSTRFIVWSKIKELLKFSKWLAGVNLFANLYGRLDILMLPWLSTAYMTGIYAAAARFMSIFPLVVSSLSSVISSRFASFSDEREAKAYFKKSLLIAIGLTGIMALLIILAKYIILIAYSATFAQAIPIFRLLVVANIPLILSIPASNAIVYFYKKPQYITLLCFVQMLGLFLLNFKLIPVYQAWGAVYSLMAMNLVGMIGNYGFYTYLVKK